MGQNEAENQQAAASSFLRHQQSAQEQVVSDCWLVDLFCNAFGPFRKKAFQEYSKEKNQQTRSNNDYINRIDERVASEEYKHMASLLEPLNMVGASILDPDPFSKRSARERLTQR